MKDNLGICPMTTSSHTLAGFGTVGGAVPPTALTDIITVTKAYSSAVGAGAFVSELFGAEADELRRRGGDAGEFGATTGRPRRVGWFDAVATKYGCMVQGATQVALTAIDCLGYLDEIKVCTGYEIDGKVTTDFPVPALLDRAKPVYETLPGWKCDIRGVTDYGKLPQAARDYVDFIEKHIEAPITIVSTGPKRHEICRRTGSWGKRLMKGKRSRRMPAFHVHTSSAAVAITVHECLPRVLGPDGAWPRRTSPCFPEFHRCARPAQEAVCSFHEPSS